MSRPEPRVLVWSRSEGLKSQLREILHDYAPEVTRDEIGHVIDSLERYPTAHVLVVEESSTPHTTMDWMTAVKERRPDIAVIVVSRNPTIEHATEAIRRGAEDFVPIPFSPELLRKEIQRLLDSAELRERVRNLRHLVTENYGFDRLVSRSARMRSVLELARAASRSDTPVLITGETGTGKELVARAIHANSRRSSNSFIPLNCAALPHDLVESELFGHRRGAFSGAHGDHPGIFTSAHGGTLLLDEIGELAAEAQAKLLRALQDKEVRPVGGLEGHRVDVRFIAATNRSLKDLRQGAIRNDLFFRLSVLVIHLPPLRERVDDIPLLVAHFLARIRARGSGVEGMDRQALELLLSYPFPGNVRELQNLLEGLSAILGPGVNEIRADDVRGWLRRRGQTTVTSPSPDLPLNLTKLEEWAVREALNRSEGNKTRAARLLGVSRDTLYRKLHELGIDTSMSEFRTKAAK